MAPLPPKTSLSKGTLGLKFMNRQAPGVVGSLSAASPSPSSVGSPAGTPRAATPVKKEETKRSEEGTPLDGGRMVFGGGAAKKEEGTKKEGGEKDESWESRQRKGTGSVSALSSLLLLTF